MKKILFKTGAILLLLGALHSCSKDDVVDNSSKNTQGESNSNPTTISKDYARLEFPKIKNTANNKVLIYKTTNGEVNYCVEWDTNKKSQRWSCYQMYRSNLTKNTNRYYTSNTLTTLLYPRSSPLRPILIEVQDTITDIFALLQIDLTTKRHNIKPSI